MNRRIAAVVFTAALGLGVASAHAGPCTDRIAQFELAVRQSAGKPDAGPMAAQSVGAQLDRREQGTHEGFPDGGMGNTGEIRASRGEAASRFANGSSAG